MRKFIGITVIAVTASLIGLFMVMILIDLLGLYGG